MHIYDISRFGVLVLLIQIKVKLTRANRELVGRISFFFYSSETLTLLGLVHLQVNCICILFSCSALALAPATVYINVNLCV